MSRAFAIYFLRYSLSWWTKRNETHRFLSLSILSSTQSTTVLRTSVPRAISLIVHACFNSSTMNEKLMKSLLSDCHLRGLYYLSFYHTTVFTLIPIATGPVVAYYRCYDRRHCHHRYHRYHCCFASSLRLLSFFVVFSFRFAPGDGVSDDG